MTAGERKPWPDFRFGFAPDDGRGKKATGGFFSIRASLRMTAGERKLRPDSFDLGFAQDDGRGKKAVAGFFDSASLRMTAGERKPWPDFSIRLRLG
jgi:hypothetical protein